MNNSNLHPIELALAIALSSIDSLLWIINELLGFHTTQPSETAPAAPTTTTITINREYILTLTVKQLQAHTGIRSSKYNKAALQSIALGGSK